MDLNEIKEFLGEDWRRVEERIRLSLASDIKNLDLTNSIILSRSGKQLRPVLSLLVARACSGGCPTEYSYRYAAAAEMLHNATLLHDDVADSSDERRGVPTIRSMMGPSVSVLVGDYWLVKAMECIFSDEGDGNSRVTMIFSRTLSNLAEGEMLQLQKAESGDTDEQDYLRIIFSKTASLFDASCLSAAISVNASPEVERAVGEYAVALGMAFQIKDDIFDYSPVSTDIGKPVGVDVTEQKMTLPLIGALLGCGEDKACEIRRKVSEIGEHPEYRDEIIGFVRENGGLEYSSARLQEYVDKAVMALDILPDSMEKHYLSELASFVAKRLS